MFNSPTAPSKHLIAAPTAVSSWIMLTPLSRVYPKQIEDLKKKGNVEEDNYNLLVRIS